MEDTSVVKEWLRGIRFFDKLPRWVQEEVANKLEVTVILPGEYCKSYKV